MEDEKPKIVYITPSELAQKLKCSPTKIQDMRRARKLPKPVRFGGSVLWIEHEIDEYLLANRAAY